MSDIAVRVLGETDWSVYRELRMTALKDSPNAFAATAAEEEVYGEHVWRSRMRRADRLIAMVGERPVGVASVRTMHGEFSHVAEVFSVWVDPTLRGQGIATALMKACAAQAQRGGHTQLVYWVGSDNGRAVAFASGFGFRPTDMRRPMHGAGEDDEEIAMILALLEPWASSN